MAIGTPTLIAQGGDNTSSTSLVLTLTAAAPTGTQINVQFFGREAGTDYACTDTAGNTYVIDLTRATHATVNLEYVLFRASNVTALAISDTITISWTTAGTVKGATAFHTTGLAATTPLTGTPITGEGDTATPDSGDITTADADAVLFGAVGVFGAHALTEDTNFTSISDQTTGSGRRVVTAYRIVSATETMDYTPTFADVGSWTAGIAAYKAAAVSAAVGRGLTDSVLLEKRRLVA